MATVDIPEPPAYPIIGHAALIDPSYPLGSIQGFADKYGEIFRMRFPGSNNVVVTTQALVNEVCDEKRFKKVVAGPLNHIRRGVHDGLFTAHDGEEPWGIAHRVLMPAFGPLKIRNMFDEMHDLASQLTLKWARVGPDTHVEVSDDFTRLTLDTIALCSMGFRFNSFYSEDMHPFVQAMADFLTECGEIDRRPLPGMFYRAKDQKLMQDIEIMRSTAEEIVMARKNGTKSESHNDLLTAMLDGVDAKTGKKMTDQSIMDNLITFLIAIAGHETTSGMLSYSFYQMLTHPETFTKAQQEVDAVCGKGPITVDHLNKLPYINGVLRETLRLTSTIGIFAVTPIEDTVVGNKYFVKKDQPMLTLVSKLHQDASVYGDDAMEFHPERMMDENFNRLNKEFPNCWKPFGNGKRSCIGRPFAWQEALLIMAMLLQNFNFVMKPGYTLSHKQTLTVKPNGFTMRPILRDGLTPTTLERRLAGSLPETNDPKAEANLTAEDTSKGVPLTVLYGSNSGTCKSLAQQVVVDGAAHGFRTVKMDCLDSVKGSLPTDHPVVIVTASFEGEPPTTRATLSPGSSPSRTRSRLSRVFPTPSLGVVTATGSAPTSASPPSSSTADWRPWVPNSLLPSARLMCRLVRHLRISRVGRTGFCGRLSRSNLAALTLPRRRTGLEVSRLSCRTRETRRFDRTCSLPWWWRPRLSPSMLMRSWPRSMSRSSYRPV
uniref:Flavodoxin-like domain-containing protein n=1 Tax=Bionectria ochroleuca TaxID=29856 RepID=A0A8H7TIC5_BIOOC